jgi:translocation and assembly module TamA
VFSAVSVDIGSKADSTGRVPLTFRMRERLQHAASVSAAYSSDLGGSTGVTWMNRNVSGKADQLTLAATAINLGGSATNGIGFDTSAKYLIPEWKERDQSLQVAVGALRQSLDAYDQTAYTSGVTVNRKLSSIWSASAGFSAEQERIEQEGIDQTCVNQNHMVQSCRQADGSMTPDVTLERTTYHYTLLSVPLSVLYNTTGLDSPLEDARHGLRASLNITPTLSIGRPKNAQFVITQANAALYVDLKGLGFGLSTDPGRSVLALRALAGLAAGAGQTSLPPDQRFYAGGGGTIRGYRYQSVGPTFSVSGNPIGGTAINAGTAEFRQRIGQNLGMAVFVDGGQVSANLNPFAGTLRFGAGAGVRYYTPIGPIRLDLAVPIQRRKDSLTGRYTDDLFEIYIGLGQAF